MRAQAIADEAQYKIVVNIRDNGDFVKEDTKSLMADGAALREYLKAEKERVESKGNEPVLHIRSDKEVEFKYVQRVMKAGATVGLKQVAYAAFNKE